MSEENAPGWPGVPARWTSSAKSSVGRALHPHCNLWYTASHGIINEVYFPRVDIACVRDMGLIVTDGLDFFSEEKRDTEHSFSYIADGVPAFKMINTCRQGRYRIEKEVFGDPRRDALIQHIRFVPLRGRLQDYRVHVLLSPHISNRGTGNTAFVGDYKGVPMLFAQRDEAALALASSGGWGPRSVGFVGGSDGWQDLHANKRLTRNYTRAENGNVALCGELPLVDSNGDIIIVLAFGRDPDEAGHRARWALLRDHPTALELFVQDWQQWQATLMPFETQKRQDDLYRVSTMVLASHESTAFPGGFIASLSIPWGFAKGDDDLGGYHLVWPRDLCETVGGLLAAGAHEDVHRVVHFLHVTQEADGHWPQNMWTDGSPYWSGYQLDETAFPLLLLDMARREDVLRPQDYIRAWPMVSRAAMFLVRNGPVTQEDRWEEDSGYTPFTLAVEIAALLVAAEFADMHNEGEMASYLRDVADCWNDNVEAWTYARDTDLARQFGVEGYYVRISPPDVADAASPLDGFVQIKNRPPGEDEAPAVHIVSCDALALVRFGLRDANDPRIVNTVKVIDGLLKKDTPFGPCWRRYNDDGYGEHDDGSPFDGTGVGRLWPLLTGERGHYELAAGRPKVAEAMLSAMERFANEGGMIPEQIWDAPDLPHHELFFGRPAGSAMPLVWAHSEYIKLRRSLIDKRVFDCPASTVQRYIVDRVTSKVTLWSFNNKCRSVASDKTLRIQCADRFRLRVTMDGWKTQTDIDANDSRAGVWYVDLPTRDAPPGTSVEFTFFMVDTNAWEGNDYRVTVVEAPPRESAPARPIKKRAVSRG